MALINCFSTRPTGCVGVTRRASIDEMGLGPLWTADDLEPGMGKAKWEMENIPAPGSWTVEDLERGMDEVDRGFEKLGRAVEDLEQGIKRLGLRLDELDRMFVPRVRRPSLWERAKGAISRRIRRRSAKIEPSARDDEGPTSSASAPAVLQQGNGSDEAEGSVAASASGADKPDIE